MLPIVWAIALIIILALLGPWLLDLARGRRRLINLIDRLPGPRALPLIGCAYQFSLDSLSTVTFFGGFLFKM
jgi:hypothetical protein